MTCLTLLCFFPKIGKDFSGCNRSALGGLGGGGCRVLSVYLVLSDV